MNFPLEVFYVPPKAVLPVERTRTALAYEGYYGVSWINQGLKPFLVYICIRGEVNLRGCQAYRGRI